MLRKLDDAIITGHQWIVDLVQKQPRWCAEQALYTQITVFVVRSTLDQSPVWTFLLIMPIFGLMFWIARRLPSELLASMSNARFVALIFLSFNLVFIFDSAGIKTTNIILRIANDLMLTMFYYFLACHPPKPRVRKPKLVPSTSST